MTGVPGEGAVRTCHDRPVESRAVLDDLDPVSRGVLQAQPLISGQQPAEAHVFNLSLDQAKLDLGQLGHFDQERAHAVAVGQAFDDLEQQPEILRVVDRRINGLALKLEQPLIEIVELHLQTGGGHQRRIIDRDQPHRQRLGHERPLVRDGLRQVARLFKLDRFGEISHDPILPTSRRDGGRDFRIKSPREPPPS